MLMHLASPDQALAEMVRVVRPGDQHLQQQRSTRMDWAGPALSMVPPLAVTAVMKRILNEPRWHLPLIDL